MSIHDTWVKLNPDSLFQKIEHLFPEGLPMRDPFPMEFSQTPDGQPVALWVVDLHRLNNEQIKAFAGLIAARHDVSIETILEDCEKRSGFFVNDTWVNSMSGGAENYRRTLELLDRRIDLEQINLDELNDFYAQQYRDWIDGDRVPEPMPEKYEDVDPRLKNNELEKAYKLIEIQKFLSDGNYSRSRFVSVAFPVRSRFEKEASFSKADLGSFPLQSRRCEDSRCTLVVYTKADLVFDVLSGRAMADALNQIDPENDWELVTD